MKTTLRCAAWLGLLLVAPGIRGENAPGPGQQKVGLCEALEGIGAGQRQTIVVSGIYAVGSEASVLYSPDQPTCFTNVQPATWVEFAEGVGRTDSLVKALKGSDRILVTFKGELYGPRAAGPDDVSKPLYVAHADRVRAIGYGHLNAFRTKLLVLEVLSATAVPTSTPTDAMWLEQPARMPEVVNAEVPRYPDMAQVAGISGTVIVEVTVKDGRVVKVERKSGDRLLAQGANANIETWRFKPATSAVFMSTFIYSLERRSAGDRGTRVEVALPEMVRIVAPLHDW